MIVWPERKAHGVYVGNDRAFLIEKETKPALQAYLLYVWLSFVK